MHFVTKADIWKCKMRKLSRQGGDVIITTKPASPQNTH